MKIVLFLSSTRKGRSITGISCLFRFKIGRLINDKLIAFWGFIRTCFKSWLSLFFVLFVNNIKMVVKTILFLSSTRKGASITGKF